MPLPSYGRHARQSLLNIADIFDVGYYLLRFFAAAAALLRADMIITGAA